MLRNQSDAADAAQEVMITLMQRPPQYRGEAEFKAWVYRVVTNVCLNRVRSELRRGTYESNDAVASWLQIPPASPFEKVASRASLEKALRQLDELGQQVFVHTFLDGMSQDEIARVTGYSRKTIGKRLNEIATLMGEEES